LIDLLVQIISYGVTYVNLTFILRKVGSINGWSFNEIIFLFNMNLFSYGFASLFIYRASRALEEMIQKGTFDNLLTKPINPYINLISQNITFTFIAHIFLSLIIFVYLFDKYPINWTFNKFTLFLFNIIGATLIQFSIMSIISTFSFWITKTSGIMNTTIYGFRNFIIYPIDIFSKYIQNFLIFILPYAFVTFFPAISIFDKNTNRFNYFFKYGTPILGIFFLILSIIFWELGIKKYKSTGN
jgi:ABC-2 type transport system permease protein